MFAFGAQLRLEAHDKAIIRGALITGERRHHQLVLQHPDLQCVFIGGNGANRSRRQIGNDKGKA